MGEMLGGVAPNQFVNNFNQQFTPDDALLEMVRRMSLAEHERNQNNAACPEAVAKLPIIEIEEKHCKPVQTATFKKLEPPTCAICVEQIQMGFKGMFVPCGHIYHPDCLNPWFKTHNSCPICRHELPKQKDTPAK